MVDEFEKLSYYKQGFQDGWNMAMKMAKEEEVQKKYKPIHEDYGVIGCPVCKKTGVSAVVCNISNCPTRAYSGAIGAVGSDSFKNYPLGSNGGAGK